MLKDPLTRWNGVFPYEALASVGITPMSSMGEILDASFDLMARDEMNPETRQAWDELRTVNGRMVIDFFLYHVDLAARLERARESLAKQPFAGSVSLDSLPVPELGDPELVARVLRFYGAEHEGRGHGGHCRGVAHGSRSS